MRIAQIAPLIESVPPRLYGGTERIVAYLTDALVEQGHDVTLFASGDSQTKARLVPCSERAMRFSGNDCEPAFQYICMLDEVWRRADSFDVFHFHIDVLHFAMFRPLAGRTVTTLHGRQDLPALRPIYRRFPEFPLVSISDSQRLPLPEGHFAATVYHGLPVDLLQPTYHPRGGYLAFLGRVSPEKRVDLAIEIAVKAGLPLKIAAKVDRVDEDYFRERIVPLLNQPGIEFIGEIDEAQKQRFLGDALALLFPIDWPEPFGLVMIEAMACATPVLAFRRGSVPEIIDDEITGMIVDSVDEAVATLPQVVGLDRCAIRRRFEQRFTADRMAADYVAVYRQALGRARTPLPKVVAATEVPGVVSAPPLEPIVQPS
jgi:glycosyltransferase involved in cell wall biosynthesis